MSDVEDRLRAALRTEADRRPVDVPALQQRVEARLSQRPRRRSRWVGRTAAPLVAAAAAAAAVAGTVVVVERLRPDAPDTAGQVQGGVDDRFTCPSRGRTVFDAGNQDDSFLPELTSDLRPTGEAAALPRYEVQRLAGGQVRVRFGAKDGALASVVVFRQAGDGYQPVTITKCTNGPGPQPPTAVAPRLASGSHAGQFTAADFEPGAVKLFDTVTYDVNGLPLLQSTWAEPCGRAVCLDAGKPNGYVHGRVRPDDARPTDATPFLYDPDTIVGRRTGYRLVVTYDRGDELVAVNWRSKEGDATAVNPVTGGWLGALFWMVVPRDDFAGVTLHRVHRTRFVPADQIKE